MSYESINLVALADRLTAARRAAKITQEVAAEHLGISRPTFIAIEKAGRRPRPEEIVKLAALYRLPVNKLLRTDPLPEPLRPHFRSFIEGAGTDDPELEDAVSKLTSFIDDYQYLERLSGAQLNAAYPPPVRIPPGPIERFAEHCAQEERARLNLGEHQPIALLRKTLEESGLHVFFAHLDSKLAGLYVFVPQFGYCILVNRRHPRERRRWTIAHEYGHFLVERERPGVDYSKQHLRKPEGERFADSFAAAFLMPEAGVRRRFYDEVNRTGDFSVADLCHMANYFQVSTMAMALRLESLGLVRSGVWDEVRESGVPLKALRRDAGVSPADDGDSVDLYPERYKLLAVLAFEEGKLSEGKLAELLRCPRIEAREIVARFMQSVSGDDSRSLSLTRSLLMSKVG